MPGASICRPLWMAGRIIEWTIKGVPMRNRLLITGFAAFCFLVPAMVPHMAMAQLQGADTTPGTACSVEDSVQLTANPSGTGGYILTCEGGVWVATLNAALPTANEQVATKEYVDSAVAAGGIGACVDDDTTLCALETSRSSDDPNFTAGNIASGVNILGVTGTLSGAASDCTNDSTVTCTLEATRSNDDPQFVAGNIRSGVNILNVTGSLANCANDLTGECILNATRATSDGQFTAANIASGVNILGVTGTYDNMAPGCTNDDSATCTLEATRSNDDPQFVAGNIRSGVNILNVTGSLANCTNDLTGECILNATRSTSDPQFVAGNIRTGTNILNVTGSLADCANDLTGECILNATRSTSDPQFVAGNIRTGTNILNVTGSLANCTNDLTGECILNATRSTSDGQFTAANIANGVNILGVTGTYTGCTAPASCTSVGGVCADGSLFAGFMVYNGSCKPLYVTNNNQTSSKWKTANGTIDIPYPSDNYDAVDGRYNRDNRGAGTFPAFVLCESNTYHGKNDWYLPARAELNLLWLNQVAINANADGSFAAIPYWSSSHNNPDAAWYQHFDGAYQLGDSKTFTYGVRCVRRD